jgi:hypothetical protein
MAPVWEPGPNFKKDLADAPKMLPPAPLPAINLGAPVEMLLDLIENLLICLVSPNPPALVLSEVFLSLDAVAAVFPHIVWMEIQLTVFCSLSLNDSV